MLRAVPGAFRRSFGVIGRIRVTSLAASWRREERREWDWGQRGWRQPMPLLAFGLFGSFGGGDKDDPFADIDQIFAEFFNRSFGEQGGSSFSYSWNSKDGLTDFKSSLGQAGDPFLANTLGRLDPESLFHAAATDDVESIRRLAKKKSVTERHQFGWLPIHVAAFHGHHRSVQALLELGSDANAKDEFTTAMQTSEESGLDPRQVAIGRQECFGVGMQLNYNFRGSTPLHYAVLSKSLDTVAALIQAGADVSAKNEDGKTPLHFAKAVKAPDIVHALNNALAKWIEQVEEKKKLEAEERRKFPLHLRLKQRLVGQEAAINTVASAIRRKENGWYDEDHPLVLLFLGSSGVGKTELAKQVAHYLHRDDPKSFIRIDMSEFQQKHEVSKFIGSPPGYVGHEEGGQLTKQLREYPEAVVLFDEVEKAHPDILTILLQLFDEGRMTDGKGETIECKKAIFVMTSNLAAYEIANRAAELRALPNFKAEEVMTREFKEGVVQPILRRALRRDEFLGRINEMVYFLPFSQAQLQALAVAELNLWKERAWKRHGIQLEWDEEVVNVLAGGYNERYGARSIKHEVEMKVVNKMATAHENEVIRPNTTVRLKLKSENEIVLDVRDGTSRSFLSDLPRKIVQQFSSSA